MVAAAYESVAPGAVEVRPTPNRRYEITLDLSLDKITSEDQAKLFASKVSHSTNDPNAPPPLC